MSCNNIWHLVTLRLSYVNSLSGDIATYLYLPTPTPTTYPTHTAAIPKYNYKHDKNITVAKIIQDVKTKWKKIRLNHVARENKL